MNWNWAESNPKIYVDMNVVDILMKARGIMSYKILANLIGVHRSTLHSIRDGKTTPNGVTTARMCAVLGCQPGDILHMRYNFKTPPQE